MSLVFDALKQQREPSAPISAPLGSVLSGAQGDASHNLSKRSHLPWLAVTALLVVAAGVSMYLLGSSSHTPPDTRPGASLVANAPTAMPAPSAQPEPVAPKAVTEATGMQQTESPAPVAAETVTTSVGEPTMLAGNSQTVPQPAKETAKQEAPGSVKPSRQASTPTPETLPSPPAAPAPVILAKSRSQASPRTADTKTSSPPAPVIMAKTQEMPAPAQPVVPTTLAGPSSTPAPPPVINSEPLPPAQTSKPAASKSKPILTVVTEPASQQEQNPMSPSDVALTVSRFNDAVRNDDLETARSLLAKITDKFGADSLVTLRMRGYLALKSDNLTQAREAYQQVVANLQNDYEANRNLAVIEIKQGYPDLAKQRSIHMLTLYPEDPYFKMLAN